jgi:hypothetical protein
MVVKTKQLRIHQSIIRVAIQPLTNLIDPGEYLSIVCMNDEHYYISFSEDITFDEFSLGKENVHYYEFLVGYKWIKMPKIE